MQKSWLGWTWEGPPGRAVQLRRVEPELQSLLDKAQWSGELQSEGEFTLDPLERARKLAEFGLESPLHCVLKLIQLLVRGGCSGLSLSLGSTTIDLCFQGYPCSKLLPSRWSEDWKTALLSCGRAGVKAVYLSSDELAWKFENQRVRRYKPRQLGVSRLFLTREQSTGLWGRLTGAGTRGEARWSRRALRACPIPLALDGRLINSVGPGEGKCALQLHLTGPTSTLSWGIWNSTPPREEVQFTDGFNVGQRDGDFHTVLASRWPARVEAFASCELLPAGPEKGGSTLGHLWLPMKPRGKSVLCFVKSGVVVGTEAWDPGWATCGVVSAEGLDTDLSGLALVKNERYERFLKYLKREVNQGLLRLKEAPVPKSLARHLEGWP